LVVAFRFATCKATTKAGPYQDGEV
jgi:hypothetical protein